MVEDTNDEEQYLKLKKELQEYSLLISFYEKREKKEKGFWSDTSVFVCCILPIPLLLFDWINIMNLSHDIVLIYMTFSFTVMFVSILKNLINY